MLTGQTILLVEDEPLLLFDASQLLNEAGADVLAADSLNQALTASEHPELTAAVLDIQLGTDSINPVCARLDERAIPFLFMTGTLLAPKPWRKVKVVTKPIDPDELAAALLDVLAKGNMDNPIGDAPHALSRALFEAERRVERQTAVLGRLRQGQSGLEGPEKLLRAMLDTVAVLRETSSN